VSLARWADRVVGVCSFHLTYATGTHCNTTNPVNCHQLTLDATAFQ